MGSSPGSGCFWSQVCGLGELRRVGRFAVLLEGGSFFEAPGHRQSLRSGPDRADGCQRNQINCRRATGVERAHQMS